MEAMLRQELARAVDRAKDAEARIAATARAADPGSAELRQLVAQLEPDVRARTAALDALDVGDGGGGEDALAPLTALYGSLNEAALRYAAVHAVAHRAFAGQGPVNIADTAEAHLRQIASAVQTLDLMISAEVVRELEAAGAECECRCPACDLGICLCAVHGANTVRDSWAKALPAPSERGLRMRRPRSGSRAEVAGLRDGDVIVQIGDREIATELDAAGVQAEVRASGGAPVRVRIDRAGEAVEVSA